MIILAVVSAFPWLEFLAIIGSVLVLSVVIFFWFMRIGDNEDFYDEKNRNRRREYTGPVEGAGNRRQR